MKVRNLHFFHSFFFFTGSRNYWLVLLSSVSSQLSFDLFRGFPILSLLHVLLVKNRQQSILRSQERPTVWWTLPVMSTTILQKTCPTLQLVWEMYHQNHVSLFGNYAGKKQNRTFLLFFKCMRWNKKKSPLILSYPLPKFELWWKGGKQEATQKMPPCIGMVCTSLVTCPMTYE